MGIVLIEGDKVHRHCRWLVGVGSSPAKCKEQVKLCLNDCALGSKSNITECYSMNRLISMRIIDVEAKYTCSRQLEAVPSELIQ